MQMSTPRTVNGIAVDVHDALAILLACLNENKCTSVVKVTSLR